MWLAGLFGTALMTVMGIIATVALKDQPRSALYERRRREPPEKDPWTEHRSGIYNRLETLDEEIQRLRNWKHDEAIPTLTVVKLLHSRVEDLGKRVDDAHRRLDKLERDR
jgi:hypothetical protein